MTTSGQPEIVTKAYIISLNIVTAGSNGPVKNILHNYLECLG